MQILPRIPRLSEFESSAWILIALSLTFVGQFSLYKLTGIDSFLIGYKSVLLLVGVLSFLVIDRNPYLRFYARVFLYGVAGLIIYRFAVFLPGIFTEAPREWDFLAFYLDGNVASAGLNLYVSDNYYQVAAELQLQVSEIFKREILDVGFKYPPPTALLFLPLSYGGVEQANLGWLLFVAATILATCILVSRLISDAKSTELFRLHALDSLALAIVIVLSISVRGLGLRHGQTTGLFTCLAILILLLEGKRSCGLVTCLGIMVKPFAVIPAFLLILGRYWSGVIAGLVTGFLVIAASLIVLGTDDWTSYLGLEFSTASPASLYYESGNKSLLAVISRAFEINEIPWANVRVVTLYSSIAVIFTVASFWLSTKIAKADFRTAYCLLLVMALLVYPGTIDTYAIILSIPLAVEFWNQYRSKQHYIVTVFFVAIAGSLLHWNMFAANLFLWISLIWRSLIVAGMIDGSQWKGSAALPA